jgi:hypothetical protein
MIFEGYHGDVPTCEIISDTETPITGGNNLQFVTTTLREYGQNLIFEPVPLEMLYSDAQKPQVMVKVNGIEGVCPNFNCDYVYTTAVGEITA